MTTCTTTLSATSKSIVAAGLTQEIARLSVQTHSEAPTEDAFGLSIGGHLIVTSSLDEAVRLFDRLPGLKVRERYEQGECLDADHDPEARATMASNAEADERDGDRYAAMA